MLSLFGYSNYEIKSKYENNQAIISMEYNDFRYQLIMDFIDKDISTKFLQYHIKNLKKLINGEVSYIKLDGETNLNTIYCKIYHQNKEYFITSIDKNIDDWIIKFDDYFGNKLLKKLEQLNAIISIEKI